MRKWFMSIVLCGCVLSAEESQPKRRWRQVLYRASEWALVAATTADVGSSWGGHEMTPFLRSADSRFGARGTTIKFGMLGGILATEHWLKKQRLASEMPVTLFNSAMAVVSAKIAVDNIGVRRRSTP